MPVPSKMADLATLAASNSPVGSESIGNSLDDYIRSGFAILRSTNALSSASLASASTTDLGTTDAEAVTITGNATITSFGSSVPGLVRELTFAGSPLITASSSIIMPNSQSFTPANGDVLTFRSLGSGQWRCVSQAISSSGTYTPTLNTSSNVTALTIRTAQWLRVGSTVTVSGSIDIAATTLSTNTTVNLTLPIPSTLSGGATGLAGTCSRIFESGQVNGVPGAFSTARLQFIATAAGGITTYYHYTYTITP